MLVLIVAREGVRVGGLTAISDEIGHHGQPRARFPDPATLMKFHKRIEWARHGTKCCILWLLPPMLTRRRAAARAIRRRPSAAADARSCSSSQPARQRRLPAPETHPGRAA